MKSGENKLIKWLFDTKALRICPDNKPFWYTSGAIGPYYINTHFLYGSEEKANNLLRYIDEAKCDTLSFPERILEVTGENYDSDPVFKGLIDEMCNYIKANISLDEIDYISGGERRDWFFSVIISNKLGKPHITIYKNMDAVVSVNGKTEILGDISGKKVLHIADLINEASSYERAWVPAIKKYNGEIKWSVVVVDRKQGGEELLTNLGIKSYALVNIDKALFDGALENKLISEVSHKMIIDYMNNPKESMKSFIKEHPEFMQNALASDEKTKERAKMCIEKGIYEF